MCELTDDKTPSYSPEEELLYAIPATGMNNSGDKKAGFIDKNIIEALSKGDENAFKDIYVHTYDSLKRFLVLLLNSKEDAEEAIQDIFLYILENTEKIDIEKNFKGYLYTIAKNVAYKQILERKKIGRYTELKLRVPPDFAQSPEELVMTDEMALLIAVYIENLPAQRKRIYKMSRNEGKSIKEIAEELGLSVSTVKNQIHTANKGLRELLALFALLFLS